MSYLNIADIVKLKYGLENEKKVSGILNNYQPTFIRNCNSKLASIDLKIRDFKTEEGQYEFTEDFAKKLIQLEELNIKKYVNNIKTEKYESIDLPLLNDYFAILEDLIKLHFNGSKKEMYLLKIKELKIEVEINKEKYNIIYSLFSEDEKQKYLLMLEKDLPKVIVEIYSIKKYPYLTDVDRFSLLHDLYENLTEVISNHISIINLANDIRNSADKQIKEMPIEQIITDY